MYADGFRYHSPDSAETDSKYVQCLTPFTYVSLKIYDNATKYQDVGMFPGLRLLEFRLRLHCSSG